MFIKNGLDDGYIRIENDEASGKWSDRITGMEIPKDVECDLDSFVDHITDGELNGQGKPTGLHNYDSFIRQLTDPSEKGIFVRKDGEDITDAISAIINKEDGSITITRSDMSTVVLNPTDEGLLSIEWGYKGNTDEIKPSTFFPHDWTKEDIEDCIKAFEASEKQPNHIGGLRIRERLPDGRRTNPPVYSIINNVDYEFTYIKDGKPYTIGVQANSNNSGHVLKMDSIYPKSSTIVKNKPNTYVW